LRHFYSFYDFIVSDSLATFLLFFIAILFHLVALYFPRFTDFSTLMRASPHFRATFEGRPIFRLRFDKESPYFFMAGPISANDASLLQAGF